MYFFFTHIFLTMKKNHPSKISLIRLIYFSKHISCFNLIAILREKVSLKFFLYIFCAKLKNKLHIKVAKALLKKVLEQFLLMFKRSVIIVKKQTLKYIFHYADNAKRLFYLTINSFKCLFFIRFF